MTQMRPNDGICAHTWPSDGKLVDVNLVQNGDRHDIEVVLTGKNK